MRRFLALIAASSLLLASCSHTVTIDSDPTGAEVRINGEKVGTTPVTYTEQSGWDKAYQIELTKPGYKPVKKELRQTEWHMPVVGGVAAGAFCGLFVIGPFSLISLVGLLFSRTLPDRVVIPMERGAGVVDPGTAAPPPSQYGY